MSAPSKRVVILVGPPGVGKGTQAKKIAETFNLYHIDTGSCIRSEIAAESPLGQQAQIYVKNGQLIPFELVMQVIKASLERVSADKQGFLFDGFPRNLQQAQGLETILKELGLKVDSVLYLCASRSILMDRLGYRLTCSNKSCQATYNSKLNQPKTQGHCDRCDAPLITREDDRPEVVENRLVTYETETAPIIDYYTAQGVVKTIQADQPIETVYHALQTELAPFFQSLVK